MKRSLLCLGWLLAIFCCRFALAQAIVDESRETATVYVDAAKGSDSNPGTKALPFKTINAGATKAVSNNQAGIGTKVVINAGTYRESVVLKISGKDTSLPITFQAATPGAAIVSGADVWTGWKAVSGNSNLFSHAWSNRWGLCQLDTGSNNAPPEQDIVRRREMIVVNGTLMTQVLSMTAMRQGTFYVDEAHSVAYLWPPSGTNMSSAMVEVPSRANLFTVNAKSNIVVRGMKFRHANSCRGDAAVLVEFGANHVLLDDNDFESNNSAGVNLLFTTNTTVQSSSANHNGMSGMAGFQTKNDLWQNNQTRYNGWRGAQGVYYAWGAAGTHFGLAHNQTTENIDSSYNQTFGFHWDTDNENDTAAELLASQNLLGGGFIEKSQGPFTVSNSYFCNGRPYSGPNNLGFELRNASDVVLTGNTLYGNQNGLLVIGQAGGITITNWETRQRFKVFTENTIFTNNVIAGGDTQELFSDGTLGGADWTRFSGTLDSDFNNWWNSVDSKTFFIPVPKQWTLLDFPGWQSATGRDRNSVWKAPSNAKAGCEVSPDKADFWMITNAFSGFQTVTRGGTAAFFANIVSLAFSGTVTLSSDGSEKVTGMNASWSSTKVSAPGSAMFTVQTSSATPRGTYPITLIATSGAMTRTMTVSVVVE